MNKIYTVSGYIAIVVVLCILIYLVINRIQIMNTAEVIKILEDNKITNVGNITPYNNMEEEAMEISRQQSKKNKEERTHSEEMQDKLEPIPCPMHEDYDDEKINVYSCNSVYNKLIWML